VSTRALYPGSFDPFTNGHLDVVRRAVALFDGVVVGVAANPEKRAPLFAPEERVAMIEDAVHGLQGVEVTTFRGLTIEFARSLGVTTLVKGLRAYSDFEAELQQALMNRGLAPEVETVFLMSGSDQIFVSSSILKDVASYGGDVSRFVPEVVARRLKEKFH